MTHPANPFHLWHALCERAAARGYALSRGSAPGKAWYSLAPLDDRRPERVARCRDAGEVERVIEHKERPMDDEATDLKAPFPYFGGKRRVAGEVWQRFGQVQNYVEPFFGSGAVLLGCPWPGHTETVNDADGLLANFWRALQAAPDEVAQHAGYPVSELDLHARHRWLVAARPRVEALLEDPDAYDAKAAGWWVWGISQWIGSGWCEVKSANVRQLPHVSASGTGAIGAGIHAAFFEEKTGGLLPYLRQLAARLRRVRVTCGDFERILGPSVTWRHGLTAVFLDPPYDLSQRAAVYAVESDAATRARAWAIANGDNPLLRIALCGYEGEHAMPDGWQAHRWKAAGGYGGQGTGRGRENAAREVIYFSPHCLSPAAEARDALSRPIRVRAVADMGPLFEEAA